MNLDQPAKAPEPRFYEGARVRSNAQFDARVHEGRVLEVKYVPTRRGGVASLLRVRVDRVDGRSVPQDDHECAGFCWDLVAFVN